MNDDVKSRLASLRQEMCEHGWDAAILPTGDPHISEYPPEHWKTRAWASGFTGSAGTLVVLQDRAALWTDGRYTIQARNELEGTGILQQPTWEQDFPGVEKWLGAELKAGATVACDGRQISAKRAKAIAKELAGAEIDLIVDVDPVAAVWKDRPTLPDSAAFVHRPPIAVQGIDEKLSRIRQKMTASHATHYLISSLDAVAWTLNIRGSDISCTPFILAHLLVSKTAATCFIACQKCDQEILDHLSAGGVACAPYDALASVLSDLPEGAHILLDPERVCARMRAAINVEVVEEDDPTQLLKATKSAAEISNMRNAIARDCERVARVLAWLDEQLKEGVSATELDVEKQLEALRTENSDYMGPSFRSIAAYGSHAAMMHYGATPESNATIEPRGLFLLDAGGQYPDGTTDLTRTVACGELTHEERRDYTLVLKAHIALCEAVFPQGTTGPHLDIIPRGLLAREGINYRCGTGHGVGFCLAVHEGPQSISPSRTNGVVLEPGMLLTNEPGVYRDGKHGIRIENLMLVCEKEETEFGRFLGFEVVSHCPIDTRPVIDELLNDAERDWLARYNAICAISR